MLRRHFEDSAVNATSEQLATTTPVEPPSETSGKTPVVAIVGHPNAGKSSVVATLTENDQIEIDQRSGTTLSSNPYPVQVDGRTVMTFIDTPGFQNPSDILEWFQAHADEPKPIDAFIAAHARNKLYIHDCGLLEPLAVGAGIILVVDGSKRIKEKDRVEMELLRLTARPRMAILNNLGTDDRHMASWQDALNKSFNAVRVFNAHRATFEERLALLNALKAIDQRWEPMLNATVSAIQQDWNRRIGHSAQTIIELLHRSLSYKVTKLLRVADVVSDAQREEISEQLTDTLREQLRNFEEEARDQIRAQFHHNVWDLPPGSLLAKDLFSDDVEEALGLKQRQMVLTGAATGAVTGGVADILLAGLALGTGTLLGGVAGATLGYFGSQALAKVDIQRSLGVERFSMGPVTHQRFPFVLLDRTILYCARAMNWSHGRKAADETAPNRVPDRKLAKSRGFTEGLSSEEQIKLAKFFDAARKGKSGRHEEAVRTILVRLLHELSSNDVDSRVDA